MENPIKVINLYYPNFNINKQLKMFFVCNLIDSLQNLLSKIA